MSLKITVAAFLMTITLCSNAQPDFRPGYVINNHGDTLNGRINYQKDAIMSQLCRFKSPGDSVFDYYPADIQSFRFTGSKFFISRVVNQKKVFLEYLFNGIVKIYYQRDESGDHYYIEKDSIPLTELSYKEVTKIMDGRQYVIEQKDFVGQLNFFMRDAPGINTRIEAINKPEHRDLVKLAEYYHNMVCKDKSCIIYEKPVPLISLSIEPIIGYVKYKYISRGVLEYGGYINIWAPRTNEKLYFRTGFIRNGLYDPKRIYNSLEDSITVSTIPFNIYYLIGKDSFKVKAGIGYNLIKVVGRQQGKPFFNVPCLILGLNSRITNSIALSFEIDTQTTPVISNFIDKFGIVTLSCSFGIRINI